LATAHYRVAPMARTQRYGTTPFGNPYCGTQHSRSSRELTRAAVMPTAPERRQSASRASRCPALRLAWTQAFPFRLGEEFVSFSWIEFAFFQPTRHDARTVRRSTNPTPPTGRRWHVLDTLCSGRPAISTVGRGLPFQLTPSLPTRFEPGLKV